MSLAEVLARLGSTCVTWLCLYAWLIWMATLRVASCTTSGDELWALIMGFGLLVGAMSPMLGLTRVMPEVHSMVRNFAWPLVLLVPLALMPLWTAWTGTTMGGDPLCPVAASATWHTWWAPLQTLLLLMCGYQVWRCIHKVAATDR